jgi:hypothetical protein
MGSSSSKCVPSDTPDLTLREVGNYIIKRYFIANAPMQYDGGLDEFLAGAYKVLATPLTLVLKQRLPHGLTHSFIVVEVQNPRTLATEYLKIEFLDDHVIHFRQHRMLPGEEHSPTFSPTKKDRITLKQLMEAVRPSFVRTGKLTYGLFFENCKHLCDDIAEYLGCPNVISQYL